MAKKAAKKSSAKKAAKKHSGGEPIPAKGKVDPLAKIRAERLEKAAQQRSGSRQTIKVTENTHRSNLDEQRAKRKSDNKNKTGGKYANIEVSNEIDKNSHAELSKKNTAKDLPDFLKGHLMKAKPKKLPTEEKELAFILKHANKPKIKMHTKK